MLALFVTSCARTGSVDPKPTDSGCGWVEPIRLLGSEINGVPPDVFEELAQKGVSAGSIQKIERAQLSDNTLEQLLAHNRLWKEFCLEGD